MSTKVYITGLGITSAIGFDVQQSLNALRSSRTGVEPIQFLDTRYRGSLLGGEVKAYNETLGEMLQIGDVRAYSRTALLGMMAAREAYHHAQLSEHSDLRTGIISATSVGGIDKSELFYEEYLQDSQAGDLRSIICHDCGDSTEKIADDLNISDHVTTISTACSSSANAMIMGARLVKSGRVDRILVGGTDALTRYTLNGFKALRIIDDNWCRPFDQNRNGLNLGEAAAFLVLESEKAIIQSKKEPICELSGYGNANDAYHQTASSPEGIGAMKAMDIALRQGGLLPKQIDYINAHGTATLNNDMSEGMAIKNLFRDYLPKFSSTKSYTGHTLAAAGAVEAVISVLSLHHHLLVPNLNFKDPIAELAIEPIAKLEEGIALRSILSNSFGFGGNCSAMIFSSC